MTRIVMLVYADYPADPRVRREAEALVEAGHAVDVVCLRLPDQCAEEQVRGVGVSRIDFQHRRGGKLRYLWNYVYFFLRALARITRLHARRRYDLVHVHNMPEFLVFAALVPKCRGARVILDLHDPMPEVFMAKFGKPASHPLIRFLCRLEQWSIRFADAVITTNKAFEDVFVRRGCPPDKLHIVMNAPQDSVFEVTPAAPLTGPARPDAYVLMYHGSVVERYGLDTAVAALPLVRQTIPNAILEVYNDGEFLPAVRALAAKLGVSDFVHFRGRVSLDQIAATIDRIDVGLVPNHRNAFTELNFPTRILEFICRRRPVIAPRTRGIMDYFTDEALYFFAPDDPADLARAVVAVWRDADRRARVIAAGYRVYQAHTWAIERAGLCALVDRLTRT
jgi:glycosyltransferase involved in cell wall biosynthesis